MRQTAKVRHFRSRLKIRQSSMLRFRSVLAPILRFECRLGSSRRLRGKARPCRSVNYYRVWILFTLKTRRRNGLKESLSYMRSSARMERSRVYETLTDVLRWRSEPLSLSEPLREDGDADLGDVVADVNATSPFDHAAEALLVDEINELLAPLDDREASILRLRFGLDRGEPRTLEEVGQHFNLTRERIRQIEARAMSKLRHPSSDTGARDLLTG